MYSPLPLGRIQYTRVMNSNKNNLPKRAPRAQKKQQPPQSKGPAKPEEGNRNLRRAAARAQNKSMASAYAPNAIATGTKSMEPLIRGGRNSCRIVHRELVASISGSASFTVGQSIPLNPGLASSFPWLASQAQAWEEYRFHKLKFCYYTRTGTQTTGSLQIVPDYDAADAAPATEQIASSFEDVVEDAPWKDLECRLNPQAMYSMGPKKFIRTGALAANLDIKTYDVGQLFVCSTDGAAVNWGKLWVEYDVEFFVPASPSSGIVFAASQHETSVDPTSSSLLPTPVVLPGSSVLASVAGNVLTFLSAGRFLVTQYLAATSVTAVSVTAAAGGALIATYGSPNSLNHAGQGGGTEAIYVLMMDAVIGSTLTISNTIVGGTKSELLIAQVPLQQT